MISKFTSLLFCSLITFSVFGQIKSYDINTYTRPEIKRHALEFDANLSNKHIKNRNLSGDSYNLFAGELNGTYYSIWDTKKSQTSLRTSTKTEYTSTKNNQDLRSQAFFNIDSRNYLKNGDSKLYWLILLNSRGSIHSGSQINDPRSFLSVSPSIGVGYGRVKKITDVWHTIRVLETLQEEGFIQDVSHELLEQLAGKITEIRNRRILDFRIARITKLDDLAQALEELNIVEKVDYRMAHRLQDAFIFEGFTNRSSGWRIEGGIGSNYALSKNFSNYNINVFAEFLKTKALTQSTQLTYGLQTKHYFKSNQSLVSAYGSYGWFPSARTHFAAGLRSSYNLNHNLNFYGHLFAHYYISPQFQIRAQLNPSIRFGNSSPNVFFVDEFDSSNQRANLSCSYKIF